MAAWQVLLRTVGDEMPLADHHTRTVFFVCKEDIDDEKEPNGTAFLVGVPSEVAGFHFYLVTAKHVIEDEKPTWVRLRPRGGGPPVDKPVPEWTPHPTADIAVAPCDIERSNFEADYLRSDRFADRWTKMFGTRITHGDLCYFVGLLSAVETMRTRAIPMVRAGRVGALYQNDVPMWDRSHTSTEPCAHLIDSKLTGGFSGAPCFVEQATVGYPPGREEGGLAVGGALALLGVLVGHFPGSNAGVSVVVPVEAIQDVLGMDVFVEHRRQRDAAAEVRAR
jgi:hypothetical protein